MSVPEIRFDAVHERDMDLLFANALCCDEGFVRLLLCRAGIDQPDVSVAGVELSKTDAQLGESDITLLVELGDKRIELLIEDKVDAIAMPNQRARYVKRGQKAVETGECEKFFVYLFCPQRYLEANAEAKLYEHCVTYEEICSYMESLDTPFSAMAAQQLKQAIARAKRPPSAEVHEGANEFLRAYIDLQQAEYPMLDLRTKASSSGWWVDFETPLQGTYIHHKIAEGYVDLYFKKQAAQLLAVKRVAKWLRGCGLDDVRAVKTGKSSALRFLVPCLDVSQGKDAFNQDEVRECLEVVKRAVEFAATVSDLRLLTDVEE